MFSRFCLQVWFDIFSRRCGIEGSNGKISYKEFLRRFQDRSEQGMPHKILANPLHRYCWLCPILSLFFGGRSKGLWKFSNQPFSWKDYQSRLTFYRFWSKTVQNSLEIETILTFPVGKEDSFVYTNTLFRFLRYHHSDAGSNYSTTSAVEARIMDLFQKDFLALLGTFQ